MKTETEIGNTQFGFTNGLGTRDALFGINVLLQRCLDMNKDIFLCLVDYEKAFDTVKHERLIQILRSKGIDDYDARIIQNLY